MSRPSPETVNPLPSLAPETPLYDLTDDQVESLGIWYRDIRGLTDCDSMTSIIGNGSMWGLTLGQFIRQWRGIKK